MSSKKTLLKIIIFILCLLTLLLGTACAEPEAPSAEPPALERWKHQVTNVDPLVAEGLLDTPDSVAYITDRFGRVEVIPAERQAAICAAFAALRRDPARLDGFLLCGAVSHCRCPWRLPALRRRIPHNCRISGNRHSKDWS